MIRARTRSGNSKGFRPLSGNLFLKLFSTDSFSSWKVSVPSRGIYFSNRYDKALVRVHKGFRPLSGNLFLKRVHVRERLFRCRFPSPLGESISQTIIVDKADKPKKTLFPSPLGESISQTRKVSFTDENANAFPSPLGESISQTLPA